METIKRGAFERTRHRRAKKPRNLEFCRARAIALGLGAGMDLTDDERDLILAGLFELTITYLDDATSPSDEPDFATRLGGDREALFFGASL